MPSSAGPVWCHCRPEDGSIFAFSMFLTFRGNLISTTMKKNAFYVKINMDWSEKKNYKGQIYNPDGTLKHKYKAFIDPDVILSASSKTNVQNRSVEVEPNFTVRQKSIITIRS